jgi:ribose-phosphate pyrophosphokinase
MLSCDADLRHGPLAILSGYSDPGIGTRLAADLSVPHLAPRFKQFDSAEFKIMVPRADICGRDLIVMMSGPGLDCREALLMGQIVGARPARICVILAYFPYARSDKNEEGMFHMPATVISILQGAARGQIAKIMSLDLHAVQIVMASSPGFISNLSLVPDLSRAILQYIGPDRLPHCVLVAPDAGSVKRVGKELQPLFRRLSLEFWGRDNWIPMAVIDKERLPDGSTRILGMHGAPVTGATPIVIDDEAASGGTLVNDLQYLREAGARPGIAAVSHPVLCGKAVERFNNAFIEKFFVGDTISVEGKPIGCMQVVSSVSELVRAVTCYHHDKPVSIF